MSSKSVTTRPPAVLAAAGVCIVQALLLVATAAIYGLEIAQGRAIEPSIASMSLTVCLVFAILLGVLAGAWWSGARWPRTPTLVWNALLLPTAWSLASSTGILVGAALAVVAIVGIIAALLTPSPDLPDRTL